MKKLFFPALMMVSALMVMGCSEPEAKFYKASDVCAKAPEGELVVTEGELVLPDNFYSTGSYAAFILKSDDPNVDLPTLNIYFLKERKNTMERIEDNYSEADIKIYDNDGNIVKLGEKLRITGKRYGAQCILSVDKIEKAK